MPEETDELIPVVVTLDEEPDGDELGLFRRGEGETAVRMVSAAALREHFEKTVASLGKVFDGVGTQAGALQLSEVQLGFEVSASGHVALVGSAGAKAAVTLVFSNPGKDST